jgi:hypothetical protein
MLNLALQFLSFRTSFAQNVPLDLVLLTDAQGKEKGAVCLDGSNPGFYITKGSGSGANKWVLYFKGGGWCYTEERCAQRAKTDLGSSTKFAKTFAFSGIMDSQASVNPTFANYNRVVMYYCDGASFSGNADAISNTTGLPLHFRGKRVLNAMLDTLMTTAHGLADATDVLLSGGSAGGLSTFLHADHVHSRLLQGAKGLTRFKAAPVSGFFLLHATAKAAGGDMLYPDEMKYVYHMQNSSGGVNANCAAAMAATPLEAWRCIFANYSYAHTAAPIFPINSAIDAWQMGNVWKGDNTCAKDNFKNCSAQEVQDLNGYMSDFLRDLATSGPTASRAGNGAFIESCLEHCGEQTGANFDGYSLPPTAPTVTMQQAVTNWWNAPLTDSASKHTYLPGCVLNTAAPHQCNPTCVKSGCSV